MKRRQRQINITKASGVVLPFSEQKLMESLRRAGATEETAREISEVVIHKLYEGVPTKKIYHWAFKLLKQHSKRLAGKYHLKQGIMELGPSGFPFEKFFSEILNHQGYKTTIGEIVSGKCVNHEIDIIAEKENHHFMVECKYHNRTGTVCDVKIPLYIQARFKDVESSWLKLPGHGAKFHQGWVVTNTKFTGDAVQYGECAGLKLIGWDYPDGGSLRSQIDTLGLYPITCLTTLTKYEKQVLLDKNIVLCKEIVLSANILLQAGIKEHRATAIISEATQLCERIAKDKNGH